MSDNLYEILGINKNASQDEIKSAYKKLAVKYHPDKNKGNEEAEKKFKSISNAYNVLTNDDEKQKYDTNNVEQSNRGGMGGFAGHGDIFEHFFNRGGAGGGFQHFQGAGMGGRGASEPTKCESINKTINITLDDIYDGINRTMSISIKKYCLNCNKKCDRCDGRGMIQQVKNLGIFQQVFSCTCDNCSGSGSIIETKSSCKECNGSGSYMKDNNASFIIPPGIDETFKTVFKDLGEQPKNSNYTPGDLIFSFNILEHKHFERKGNDLYYKTDISFIDSIIGKNISIPYFKEAINMNTKILGVISHGKKYLLEGKGLPIINTKNKGNMFIEFNISYPKMKNDDNVEELRKLLALTFY
jgi:molecular chaperone DnaJ